MIKSFKGNSLVELDKEVNLFISDKINANIVNFTSTQINNVPRMVYIYVVEYEENNEMVLINKSELDNLKELALKYEDLCR